MFQTFTFGMERCWLRRSAVPTWFFDEQFFTLTFGQLQFKFGVFAMRLSR